MRARSFLHGALLGMLVLGTGIASAATTADSSPRGGYSAALIYDQANADARDGKLGVAVLNYERGRLLAPRDEDIRANLNAVRDLSGLAPSSESWFDRHAEFANPNTLFWLGCLGILIGGTSELARRRFSAHRLGLRAASFAGLALTLVTLCDATAVWPAMSDAVVIVPTTSERVAPATLAEPLSVLREGEIVSVEAARAEFALVRSATGLTGWVSRADLARVVPNS
jgi:hypothetical protein